MSNLAFPLSSRSLYNILIKLPFSVMVTFHIQNLVSKTIEKISETKGWLFRSIIHKLLARLNSKICYSSVQSLSLIWFFATPWTSARQASLSITNSRSSPKLMSIESVIPSNHLIFCRPLLLLPSIFPSIRVFSNESALRIWWPKHWSFSFNISPSSEHPGLISFKTDWLDLLVVQGTLKTLLQHHSSKASIFGTQLSS